MVGASRAHCNQLLRGFFFAVVLRHSATILSTYVGGGGDSNNHHTDPSYSFAVVAMAEPLEQRQALFDFYTNAKSWANACRAQWSSMGSVVPVTFCDSNLHPQYSTFYGVYCWSAGIDEIVFLALGDCQISGTLPDGLSTITSLQQLHLPNNQFDGPVPPSWSSMALLGTLSLYNNRLTGTLPPQWSSMIALQKLWIDTNRLSGSLPSTWSSMTQLQEVQIYDNFLTGTLPPEWERLTRLEKLYLYGNELSGTLPGEWSRMASLKELYLFQNRLTGSLPWQWVLLSKLSELGLGYNELSGTLPSIWESLGSIQLLYLNRNDFSGSLPWEWSRMSSVTTLALGENRLEGTLPPDWAQMSSLQHLLLQRNQLSGTLPSEWSIFAALRRLYLHDNLLVGSLPEQWGGLTPVLELILNQNELTGTLPPQWSNMANVERLYLQENQLSGTLPAQWGRMQRMQGIELQRNNLVGTVPPEWANGMRAIQQTQYCVVSCNQSTCVGRDDSKGCFNVSLWYNCIEGLFPPIYSTNTWNWNSPRFALGLQRNDCLTPSLSVSATPTGTSSKRITHTRTVGLPTLTASIPFSSSRPDRSLTESPSVSFPPSSASQSTSLFFPTLSRPYTTSLRSFCPSPSRTRSESVTEWVSETNSGLVVSESVSGSRSDEISVTGSWTISQSRALPVVESPSFYRFNRIANGVATGLTAVAGVITGSATGRSLQRASLQRALTSCGREALVEQLDIASSPTQLRFGPADGQYLRGAVVGNLVLLSAIGLLCLLWSARWRIYRRVSWRAALALLQLPGLFTIPVTLFLQPTVTCSVWCVTSLSADVAIGLIGLLLSVLYVGWAIYTVTFGRGAVGKLRPNVHSETMNRIPPLLRTALLGVQDTTTEWCNRRPGFVESYGTLLCGYGSPPLISPCHF